MKRLFFLSAAAAALSSAASADENYIKVFAGAGFGGSHDIEITIPNEPTLTASIPTKTGISLGGALGRNLSENFALEGEVSYRSNDIKAFTSEDLALQPVPSGFVGKMEAITFMANGVLKVADSEDIRPYVGAGVGGALRNAIGDNDIVLAYQGFAGVEKRLSDVWAAGVEYRYVGTGDAKFINDGTLIESYDNHSANLTLRRKF